jgi:ureidoglycolate hydrolase
MRYVTLRSITPDAFAPYGEVIVTGDAFGRVDFVACVENGRAHARANLATVRLEPTPLPATVDQMERHPRSSQAFVPLDVAAYVVVVAPDVNDAPDAANAIGFVVPMGTGLSYRTGVWHTGMMVLDRPGALMILVHEDGTSDDCHFRAVDPFRIGR